MPTKTEFEAEKLAHVAKARDLAAKAETEGRNLTAEERTEITSLIGKAKAANDQILALDGDAKLRDELSILGRPAGDLAKGATALPGEGKTLGEKFTSSEEFRGWLSSVAPSGRIAESAKGLHSPAVAFGMKDLVTGASGTSGGALVSNDWRGLLDGLAQFQRPLTIVDLITRGNTQSDTVEYARVTGFTNNAAPVPEATTAGAIPDPDATNTAGLKPESGLALEKVTAAVKTIAHWLPATKRALSDAAQIRTLIDQFLRYGLEEALEDQVLTGDDTGENFEGILSVSGTQGQAWDTDLLTTTRKARTLVRTVGRARPTAFVFHPNDNERIDLLKNSNGDFYFGGPTSNPSAPLWGLPRVESEAMPEGTGMVADWRMAVLWDREEAAIQVSDSHADFFVRNLVAILAEMRAAFGVIRPKAFVEIDLTAGS
jgi:HK97 family phage major capsid protein